MGRGKGEVTKLRESILRRRGLRKGTSGRLDPAEPIPCKANRGDKTFLMVLIERLHDSDIDSLLDTTKTLSQVSRKLGIDQSTVSKWRLQRGLRDTKQEQVYVLE